MCIVLTTKVMMINDIGNHQHPNHHHEMCSCAYVVSLLRTYSTIAHFYFNDGGKPRAVVRNDAPKKTAPT